MRQVKLPSQVLNRFLTTYLVNISSHVIGSALFFALPIPVYKALGPRYDSASTADIVVFSTFFFGVAICFALSATYDTFFPNMPSTSRMIANYSESFHVFNNHSERVHILGNQLDYVSAFHKHGYYETISLYQVLHSLTSTARHRDSDVGLHCALRVLRFLLHANASKNLRHACVSTSSIVHICDSTPSLPSPKVSSLSRNHVCRPRPIFHYSYYPRNYAFWVGNADVADEPRLDGVDDDIQSDRRCFVRFEGRW